MIATSVSCWPDGFMRSEMSRKEAEDITVYGTDAHSGSYSPFWSLLSSINCKIPTNKYRKKNKNSQPGASETLNSFSNSKR